MTPSPTPPQDGHPDEPGQQQDHRDLDTTALVHAFQTLAEQTT